MTKTADELIATLPTWMQDNFKRISGSEAKAVAPENTNRGRYAALDDSFHDAEPAEQAAPAPKFTGRISQSVHVEKGCELSVWRNGNEVKVEVRNFLGRTAYGKMSGVMGAEGGFGPPVDDEDKAFTDKVFGIVVGPERNVKPDPNNFNYSKRATCLWMNRDFNGLPVAHSFLIIDWGSFSNGAQYAKEAILFDGDRVFSFPLQKQSVTSTSHPQWKGRCS